MNIDVARLAGPRGRRLASIAVVVVALMCMGGVVLAAGDGSDSKGVVVSEMAKADQALAAARERELVRSQRQRSRSLFEGMAAGDALELGGQAFPGALHGRVWTGLGLANGEKVDKYLSEFSARIVRPGRTKAIVESTVPLRAVDEAGDKLPVDLALEDRGGHLRSANPLVGVLFSKDPAQGVRFEHSGVGVSVEGASAEASGVARDDRLAVPAILPDTDFWAAPTSAGFESFALLRSAKSPESIVLDVDLPQGAELRGLPDGGAVVVRGDEQLVSVSEPFATDADGQVVKVGMAVESGRLVLSVPHRDADVRYPVLVDPEFV